LELQSSWDLYRPWYGGPNDTAISEDDWETLGHLITQLPGLTDILYVYDAQLPSFFWQFLVDKGCRLHHCAFDDQTLATTPTVLHVFLHLGLKRSPGRKLYWGA
jgi:hypothetical protein